MGASGWTLSQVLGEVRLPLSKDPGFSSCCRLTCLIGMQFIARWSLARQTGHGHRLGTRVKQDRHLLPGPKRVRLEPECQLGTMGTYSCAFTNQPRGDICAVEPKGKQICRGERSQDHRGLLL